RGADDCSAAVLHAGIDARQDSWPGTHRGAATSYSNCDRGGASVRQIVRAATNEPGHHDILRVRYYRAARITAAAREIADVLARRIARAVPHRFDQPVLIEKEIAQFD